MSDQQPTVGRIVHVVSHNGECQAAIITQHGVTVGPHSGEITVTIFPPLSSPYPERSVPYFNGGGYAANPTSTWHWPERTE